jgi:hypothetical protein
VQHLCEDKINQAELSSVSERNPNSTLAELSSLPAFSVCLSAWCLGIHPPQHTLPEPETKRSTSFPTTSFLFTIYFYTIIFSPEKNLQVELRE